MTILVVLPFSCSHPRGLTVHPVRVAEHLAERGHRWTVLTTRHRPESPIVATLCCLLGRMLLVTHHGDVVMPDSLKEQPVEQAAFHILRAAASGSDGITTPDKDDARFSKVLCPFRKKRTCNDPPVEFPEPDLAAAAAWKHDLGLDGKRLIGVAGRRVSEKGFDDRAELPEAHLFFAGERNVGYDTFYHGCRLPIERQRDHSTFLGLIRDRRRLADFSAILDLFVVPVHTDMMALTQVEAMLCGTPVVATDRPGTRVVMHETGFGRLAPPYNPPELARTIVATLRDRERYRPTPAGVRRMVTTRQTIDAYEQLLEQPVQTRSRTTISAARSGAWCAVRSTGVPLHRKLQQPRRACRRTASQCAFC